MEKFELFYFDEQNRLYFTPLECWEENDPCKQYLFEAAVGGQLLTERFEIFQWTIAEIVENLKALAELKRETVDIPNHEGAGNLRLSFTDEGGRVAVTFTTNGFLDTEYEIAFTVRADQTILYRFISALQA